MARHNLAARSLRHLRFARRMTANQPLLARVTQITHLPIAISFDGYQLPMGRIVRRLPQSETKWLAESQDSEADAASAADISPAAETQLRLLPRLPETHAADTTSAPPGNEIGEQPRTTSSSTQPQPRRVADDAPPAKTTTAPGLSPVRADAPRPRSRIVELPGTVSLPVEESSAEEPIAPDIPADSMEDVPGNTRVEPLAYAHATVEGEPEQRPLMREADEQVTPISGESAQMAVTPVPPAASATLPSSTPRRRGKQTAVTPPRASDALFPPTDADRSPATWLARLQHANEPTSPARPAPPDIPLNPGNEPPTSTPVQRPGARGSRKGAARTQASTTSAPHEHTTSTTTTSPEQSQQSQQSQSEEQPAQLPDSSRTLLHTLTGVDPANVRVYRGPVAERATSAQHADALTDGGAIALGGGHATDTPETLGLLAHELTHVAQRRIPRFVPPVAQRPLSQHRNYAGTVAPMQEDAQPAASPADEETQAIQVEARVTRVARAKATPSHAIQPALPAESAAATAPARQMPSRPDMRTRPVWGSLPAPWEPLPEWMATPAESPASAPQTAPQPTLQPQPASSAPGRAPSADTPGTQRAERGRSLPADVEESSPAHIQAPVAPEPDLDLLAQQVHAILKRRLAAERRRFG